ncbi:hypothetical protein ACIGMX_21065 [Streptomyces aquilus]|uniref:Uncharacterized protein n=1 Tax=Streptomyces aquilus TaxID=2548456 RepID=A0A3Q9C2G9_9ACTN|nr:hypothetical protein [Streptomyces aquilus]AZP17702.1 hypothetical protein EJC51_17275 [Streptomyces aquilus]
MINLLIGALGGALSTILVSACVACTRGGQQLLTWLLSYPQRRRVKSQAQAGLGQGSRAWLTGPIEDDTFDTEINVEGRVLDLPQDHEVWIVHRIPNSTEVWPKEKLTLDASGWFKVTTLEGGRSRSMAVVVLLTSKHVSQEFDAWFQQGRQTGRFPSVELPSSARVLASAVVRSQPVP